MIMINHEFLDCHALPELVGLVQPSFRLVPLLPDHSTRSFLLAAPNQVQIMFALLDLVSWDELRPVPSGISCVASSWRLSSTRCGDKCQEMSGVGASVDGFDMAGCGSWLKP